MFFSTDQSLGRRLSSIYGIGIIMNSSHTAHSESLKIPERASIRWQGFFPILLLVGLIILFSLVSSRFMRYQNFMIIAQQAVVICIGALGMTFVIIGGSIDLSVGSVVALTALVSALTARTLGVAAVVPACITGALCGLVNGFLSAKGKVPSFIVTMGALVVYRGLVLMMTHGAPVEITDTSFLRVYADRTLGVPHSAVIMLIMIALCIVLLNNTPFGRYVRAIGGGERVAWLTGIRVVRIKIAMFTLAGLLAGLAGLLQSARVFAATPTLGEGLELDVIAAVVVGGTPLTGGIGTIYGTIIGTLIIAVLSNGMNMMGLSPYLQYIAKGVVLVVAVFLTIDRSKIGIIK